MDKATKMFVARCHDAIAKRDEREIRACLASLELAGGKAKNLAIRLNKALAARHKS